MQEEKFQYFYGMKNKTSNVISVVHGNAADLFHSVTSHTVHFYCVN